MRGVRQPKLRRQWDHRLPRLLRRDPRFRVRPVWPHGHVHELR